MLVGLIVAGFLAVLLFGLTTGRIDWRQQGCCAADPADDARMKTPEARASTSDSTVRGRES